MLIAAKLEFGVNHERKRHTTVACFRDARKNKTQSKESRVEQPSPKTDLKTGNFPQPGSYRDLGDSAN